MFPAKHLRELKRHWQSAVYYNLYGPTEITVLHAARIPYVIPDDRESPFPIGFPVHALPDTGARRDGREVGEGGEGLLYISGPSVFSGYWNRPEETAAAFLERTASAGTTPAMSSDWTRPRASPMWAARIGW